MEVCDASTTECGGKAAADHGTMVDLPRRCAEICRQCGESSRRMAAMKALHDSEGGTFLRVRVRLTRYLAFAIVVFGFLLQWPALPTLVMFPVLLWVYARHADREARDGRAEFAAECERYAVGTHAVFPAARPVVSPRCRTA